MKSTHSFTRVAGCLLFTLLLSAAAFKAEAQIKPDVFQAVLKSDVEAFVAALNKGDDINRKSRTGSTPLMIAAKIGDRPMIEALLSNRADVNARNKVGATALMIAAKYGHPHVIAELLKHGADPTLKTHRNLTAANFARGYKHYKVHEQLKEAEKKFIAQAQKQQARNLAKN